MLDLITSQFSLPGKAVKIRRFGPGLINDTYLCEVDVGGKPRNYILQRINASVFTHPQQVMQNIEAVTAHIAKRLRAEGVLDPSLVTPGLVLTRSGHSFLLDGSGDCWRMFPFIEAGMVFDTVQDNKHAYELGRGLGRFQSLVSDLPTDSLHDTLPGFHFTPHALAEYDRALTADVKKRAAGIVKENAFIDRRRPLAPLLTDLIASKELPLRVVHNDPKVNNIMVHRESREALCMLDLDTVKPGLVHFDFGDCVRSATNPAGEDAQDLEAVAIDLSLFEAVTEGYLREARAFLTNKELEMLPWSVKVITFELGLRFLADYLRGDIYFKTTYQTHNLHRARVQFKLLESIETVEKNMVLLFS